MKFIMEPNLEEQELQYRDVSSEMGQVDLRKSTGKGRHKKEKVKKECLVLWDIENVNFYDDYKVMQRYVDMKNSLLYVVGKEPDTYPNGNRLSNPKVYIRLKKRGWSVDKRNKKIDERLMSYYYKHKSNVKKMILITADSDFSPILEDAVQSGIEVLVLNEDRNAEWFKKYGYEMIER